ncbi:hypothetical protein SAMN02745116_02051 [Pilibacter termitis]|uniref:DUF5590 domain-containing protein n=1 Tax=Pilibacter termitis TaxID=263852 RepID=A0A1T4Q4Y8_9ENTE|nr:hypothetical protein [Pilibacter termitis]SJZ98278.1 hypothetical protein SAMN02745116_02051 [Pilibacter termitis]
MKRKQLLLVLASLFLLSACENNSKTSEKKTNSTSISTSTKKEQEVFGVLTHAQLTELKTNYFNSGEVIAISFDNKQYKITGYEQKESNEEITFVLNKFDLTLENKEVASVAKKKKSLDFHKIAGVDQIKGEIAVNSKTDFTNWTLEVENDKPVYLLDNKEKLDAETAKHL